MTQVSWKRQLILAIALFALGMFSYWLEFKHKPESEEKETETKKLFDLKDNPVESIAVTSGDKKFLFTCEEYAEKHCKPGDNSKWDVTEPQKLKADDSNLNSFLSSLNSTESTDTIDLKDETPEKRAALLRDYGLDPALRATGRKIEVKSSKGDTIAYFGGTHPIGGGIFTAIEKVPAGGKATGAIDEMRVLLTPSYFKNNFDHDLTYWRDKKILADVHSGGIESFTLDSAKSGKLSGERKNGEWSLTAGKEEYLGDHETVDMLLNGLSFLTAKDFPSEEALKGTKPVLRLTVQPETPKPQPSATPAAPPMPITVSFLAKTEPPKAKPKGVKPAAPAISKLYVTVSGRDLLYEVDVYAKDRFEKSLKDLRMSKLLTSLDRFAAKRIELSGEPVGAQPIILVMDGGKWTEQPSKKQADSSKVQTMLDKLSTSKIKDFLEGKSIPTGQDSGLSVSIGDDKTPDKKKLVLWKADGKVYARDPGAARKEAYLLDDSVAQAFPFDPAKSQAFFDQSATPAPPPTTPAAAHKMTGGFPPGLKGMPMGHPPVPHGQPQPPQGQ